MLGLPYLILLTSLMWNNLKAIAHNLQFLSLNLFISSSLIQLLLLMEFEHIVCQILFLRTYIYRSAQIIVYLLVFVVRVVYPSLIARFAIVLDYFHVLGLVQVGLKEIFLHWELALSVPIILLLVFLIHTRNQGKLLLKLLNFLCLHWNIGSSMMFFKAYFRHIILLSVLKPKLILNN